MSTDHLNGVYIELSMDEEGNLSFGGGWDFDEHVDEDYVAYMQTLLKGLYAILSTQHDNVMAAGNMANVGAYLAAVEAEQALYDDEDYEDDGQMEFVFEPDEALLRAIEENQPSSPDNIVDFANMKFDPRKHRKQ